MNLEYFDAIDGETIVYFSEITGEQYIISKNNDSSWSVLISTIDDNGDAKDVQDDFVCDRLSAAIAFIEDRENG